MAAMSVISEFSVNKCYYCSEETTDLQEHIRKYHGPTPYSYTIVDHDKYHAWVSSGMPSKGICLTCREENIPGHLCKTEENQPCKSCGEESGTPHDCMSLEEQLSILEMLRFQPEVKAKLAMIPRTWEKKEKGGPRPSVEKRKSSKKRDLSRMVPKYREEDGFCSEEASLLLVWKLMDSISTNVVKVGGQFIPKNEHGICMITRFGSSLIKTFICEDHLTLDRVIPLLSRSQPIAVDTEWDSKTSEEHGVDWVSISDGEMSIVATDKCFERSATFKTLMSGIRKKWFWDHRLDVARLNRKMRVSNVFDIQMHFSGRTKLYETTISSFPKVILLDKVPYNQTISPNCVDSWICSSQDASSVSMIVSLVHPKHATETKFSV